MEYLPLAIPALIAAFLVYGRWKYGSWTGSFMRSSIRRTVGEIELGRSMGASQALKVHTMKGSDGEADFVGLVIVSKAVLGGSMQGYKLSKAQAQELARYLTQAAQS